MLEQHELWMLSKKWALYDQQRGVNHEKSTRLSYCGVPVLSIVGVVVSIFCTRRRVRADCGSVVVSVVVTSGIATLSLLILVQKAGTAGIVLSIVGTFLIRVSIPNALNIDSLRRSINLSVVFVMSVTTIRTPLIATIHTANLAT